MVWLLIIHRTPEERSQAATGQREGAIRHAARLAGNSGFIPSPRFAYSGEKNQTRSINPWTTWYIGNFDRSIANAPYALMIDDLVSEQDAIHDLCPQLGQFESLCCIKFGELDFARDAGLGRRHPKNRYRFAISRHKSIQIPVVIGFDLALNDVDRGHDILHSEL